jgi:arabinogalactan endo-1,4-beta-galactosidase
MSKLKREGKIVKSAVDGELYNRKDRRNAGLRNYNFSRRSFRYKGTAKNDKKQFWARLAYEQHKQTVMADVKETLQTLDKEIQAEKELESSSTESGAV